MIIFNKCDLLDEEQRALQTEIKTIYETIGYCCFEVSSYDAKQIELLRPLFKDQLTLIAGHSGVGKSTFINALEPALDLRTGAISTTHAKGMHTTTFAELHPLSFGGGIIDSPGIKELGLVEMKKRRSWTLFSLKFAIA